MATKKRQRTAQADGSDKPPPAIRRKLNDQDLMARSVEWYGKKKIDVILLDEEREWIWMINLRSSFGFAKITDPEWGSIALDDIVRGEIPPKRILEDELPCTFKELIEKHPEFCKYFRR